MPFEFNWNLDLAGKWRSVSDLTKNIIDTVFLSPPRYVWGIPGLALLAGSIGLYLKNRWVEASPNEWLIVIRDGKIL